jgi:two-component system response regulator YesN
MEFPFFRRLKNSDSTLELIKALFNTKTNNASDIINQKAMFLKLLSLLLKGTDNSEATVLVSKSMRTVLRVKGFIDHNFKTDIQVNVLADKFRLTTSHLCRSFRENLGVTPTKYIRKLRLNEAERLICETSMSIAEISYIVGFNDPNYFARIFRNTYGFAPSNHPKAKIEEI